MDNFFSIRFYLSHWLQNTNCLKNILRIELMIIIYLICSFPGISLSSSAVSVYPSSNQYFVPSINLFSSFPGSFLFSNSPLIPPQDRLNFVHANNNYSINSTGGISAVNNYPFYLPAVYSPVGSLLAPHSGSIFSPFTPFAPFFTGSQVQSFGIINGGLITWPRAEVVLPASSPLIPVNYSYTIVNAYPHDRIAFTQGLDYENGFIYEGTGIPGRSSLRRVDLTTGTVLQNVDLASPYWGEGITIYGSTVIQLTWLHNIGFVYDKNTFSLLREFNYPTEGWGITHDGKSLIISDGSATLHLLDPATFLEIGQLDVYDNNGPVSKLNELEYIKGEIYANVWLTNRIAIISPTTGQVTAWIDLTGLLSPQDLIYPVDVLNGIAYDAKLDRLFVTGKFWPKLFEIDLIPL